MKWAMATGEALTNWSKRTLLMMVFHRWFCLVGFVRVCGSWWAVAFCGLMEWDLFSIHRFLLVCAVGLIADLCA
jgi:hypothetical protein